MMNPYWVGIIGRYHILAAESSSTQRTPNLMRDLEEPRKGGDAQLFHGETQFSNATPQEDKSPCMDNKGNNYRQTCHKCDVEHLRKDCPYYQTKNPQTMMLPSLQSVEQRVNPPLPPFNIGIVLFFEKRSVCTFAHVDPNINNSVVSYNVWKKLGRPISTPKKDCHGSIILTVTIQDQPMSCTFYVAYMNETIEDVTLGQYWMSQTDDRMDDKVNTYSMKVNSLILTGEQCTKEPIKVLEVLPS